METEQNNKLLFLDANFIHELGQLTANVYRKPTFSSASILKAFYRTHTKLV